MNKLIIEEHDFHQRLVYLPVGSELHKLRLSPTGTLLALMDKKPSNLRNEYEFCVVDTNESIDDSFKYLGTYKAFVGLRHVFYRINKLVDVNE